jgi:glycosyltransferase involved in cell wall biosynthesis
MDRQDDVRAVDGRVPPGTCVVVPAFNEATVIGGVLDDLAALRCTVVVVDDGSTDETYRICLSYPCAVLRHCTNLGQGAALQTGLAYALDRLAADFVVTFDADGQHRAADIPRLLAPLVSGDADVALGTRFARSETAAVIPRGRRWLLRVGVAFTRLSTRLAVTDTHNGLRAFTAPAVSRLRIEQAGMAHASEILHCIHRQGLRWREVPVTVDYTSYSARKGQRHSGAIEILWDLVAGRMR